MIEHHAGDPEKAARALVEAANEAGGKDNVTVILVETEDYARTSSAAEPGQVSSSHFSRWTWFLLGVLAASAVFLAARPYWEHSTAGLKLRFGVVLSPRSWTVGPDAITTIGAALDRARPGDTIEVSPANITKNLHLRSGISVVSTALHGARILSPNVAVLAEDIHNARLTGFDIAGPGRVGIRIANSDLHVTDVRVSGMQNAGIEITGAGESVIQASEIRIILVREFLCVKTLARALNTTSSDIMDMAPRCCPVSLSKVQPLLFSSGTSSKRAEQSRCRASPSYDAGSLLTDNVVDPEMRDKSRQVKVTSQ